jgi:excisionase family DNA binding protein
MKTTVTDRRPRRDEARTASRVLQGSRTDSGGLGQDRALRPSAKPRAPEAGGSPGGHSVIRAAFLSVKAFGTVVDLSENTVLRRIRDKEIRAVRIGRLWRIPVTEVGRLLG